MVITRMKVLSGKRMELSQVIESLVDFIRAEKGCRCCECCQSIEDENQLFLFEEWDTREDLMAHQRSGHYRVFQGAMSLLKEPYERMCHTALVTS